MILRRAVILDQPHQPLGEFCLLLLDKYSAAAFNGKLPIVFEMKSRIELRLPCIMHADDPQENNWRRENQQSVTRRRRRISPYKVSERCKAAIQQDDQEQEYRRKHTNQMVVIGSREDFQVDRQREQSRDGYGSLITPPAFDPL